MELLAGAAAAAWGGGELFSYNRENYMFDKELLIKRDYQGQKMRVKRAELYREDIRDLVQLTVRKMDNYLVVSTLQLGFCMTLYVEGRPKPDIGLPLWLIHLFAICNAGAFLYYILSIWLAMHASVAAHAFGVRLLTQVVRLPIPDDATLDKSRFKALQYEGNKVKEMFRVPVLQQQIQRFTQAMDKTDEEDSVSAEVSASGESATNSDGEETEGDANFTVVHLPHIKHFRRIQAHWQSYDAYARVCMAMGTNQLLHTLSYMMLGTLVAENDVPFPALCCVVIFTTCAWVLARLDLFLSRRILAIAGILLVLPPAIVTGSLSVHRGFSKVPLPAAGFATMMYRVLVPIAFFLHILWIVFTVFVAKARVQDDEMALPTNFRSVLFLDVFGWLAEAVEDQDDEDATPQVARTRERQLSTVSEGIEGLEELPAEALREAIGKCHQLRARLEKDLARFASENVQAMLSEDECDLRLLRHKFNQLSTTLGEVQADLPASSNVEVPSEESQVVWVRVDLESNGRTMQVFQNCEDGTCICEEPPTSGRIVDVLCLRTDMNRFAQQVSMIRRQRHLARNRARSAAATDDDVLADAPSVDLTFHPAASQAQLQDGDDEEQEEEQRRAERSRLSTTGRMPWRTVKLGSLVLLAAWTVGLVWIIAFISFEAMHHHKTSTLEQTLLADLSPTPAWLQLGHERHKVTFSLPRGEPVSFTTWPGPFSRPTSLACHPGLDALFVLDKYVVQVLAENNLTNLQQLQAQVDSCLFGQLQDFQAQGLQSATVDCEEASTGSCTLWLLAASGLELLSCPLGGSKPARLWQPKGGPWRSIQIHGEEFWALRSSGAFDDDKDHVVQLQQTCADNSCELLPRRDLDISGRLDSLLRWPGVPWLFTWATSEGVLRGFNLVEIPKPMARLIELTGPRRSKDERWLGACVGRGSLYSLEDLGQSADQRMRIFRRSLDMQKTSLSP
ncbi:unnamed protein product [Durusdinium trenchii]|uniref:Uncharacterized protein n=2 Tax=Durusdinium trenchii TaxID=1381693 RepID=A0ABP0P6A5_9DINO